MTLACTAFFVAQTLIGLHVLYGEVRLIPLFQNSSDIDAASSVVRLLGREDEADSLAALVDPASEIVEVEHVPVLLGLGSPRSCPSRRGRFDPMKSWRSSQKLGQILCWGYLFQAIRTPQSSRPSWHSSSWFKIWFLAFFSSLALFFGGTQIETSNIEMMQVGTELYSAFAFRAYR